MNKIRVLPEILANKIAAGEIVERPASVVKELLENAIDAEAGSIGIEIEAGGKRLIRVSDDGEGMSQDDAILAFEHHATSKILTANDLVAIRTLGFRGEALPSIASIARVRLRTRARSADETSAGTEVVIEGGIVRNVKPVAWDSGTEIVVHDLFFNVPARRKFLRSNETELGHIVRLVTHYALAFPEKRYRLVSDGRTLLDLSGVQTLRERVYQVFGDRFLDHMVEFEQRAGDITVSGMASRPHEQRSNPYSQFYYVNRRMVRDKVIASAIRKAYQNSLPASSYPVVILFVDLPFDQVDVNAHPAKIEIRFRQQNSVHDFIRDSIHRSILGAGGIPRYQHYAGGWGDGATSSTGAMPAPGPSGPGTDGTFAPALADSFQRAFHYPVAQAGQESVIAPQSHHAMKLRADLLWGGAEQGVEPPFSPAGVRILGQLQESYIIACDSQGLLLIDQHVAHERVLYEKLAGAMTDRSVETQGLLIPLTVELAPHQMATLRRALPELNRNGFEVEPFGGGSILVRSVPALVRDLDCERLLFEILEGLDVTDRTTDVERVRDRIAVSTACHAAIKVNMPLTMDKMQWLLDELGRARIPTNCPHGRPILLRFSMYEIERNFGRV